MPSSLRLFRAEAIKLLRLRLTWVLLVLLIVIQALRVDNIYSHAFDEPPAEITPATVLPEDYWQAAILPGVFERARLSYDWLSIFAILLTAMTLGQEFTWGTMRTILARGTGRGRLLMTRFAALVAVIACYLAVLWLACGILGLLTTQSLEGGINWGFLSGEFLAKEIAALARTWVAIWPSVALALLIAVWTRNPGLSLSLVELAYGFDFLLATFSGGLLGIYLAYVVEAGLDPRETGIGIWGILVTLIPHYNITSVIHWGQPGKIAELANSTLFMAEVLDLPRDPWRCLGLLLGYGLVALVLAVWTFQRKDVTL